LARTALRTFSLPEFANDRDNFSGDQNMRLEKRARLH